MAVGYIPKLAEETCGEILDAIAPENVGHAVRSRCPSHPELDRYRVELLADRSTWPDAESIGEDNLPEHFVGIGFDAGRYLLTLSGITIPRVPMIYLYGSGDSYFSVDDRLLPMYYDFDGAQGYRDATSGWSGDNYGVDYEVQGGGAVELIDYGFAKIYIVATLLVRAGVIASN